MANPMSTDNSPTGTWLRRVSQALSGEPQDRAELVEHLRDAHQRGLVDSEALQMLLGVLEVADIQVRDIMVPRAQMIFVRRGDPPGKLVPAVLESGHSRFPVMDADRDHVVGILLAKDLLRMFAGGEDSENRFDIRECMRPAVFVPESKRVNVLLKEFRSNRNHMAIVVDEYGGVSGLVTIEDALEQIVGEIDDEFDEEDETNIRREDARNFSVRGATPIDEFNQYFSTKLADDEFDTIAGLVIKQLGRLPRRGEAVTIEGFEFKVARADRRRVDTLRLFAPRDISLPKDSESAG
jgi:magnesium and cobalt transporter